MDPTAIAAIVSVLSAVSGVVLGWVGRSRTVRHDTIAEASKDATLQADMAYIKRGIDDVRVEQKVQGQRFEVLSERVTRVEESAKQAHKRIDKLEDNN